MIESLLVFRFFSDYFWELKIISVVVALFLPIIFILYLCLTERLFIIYFVDGLFLFFLSIVCFSELFSGKSGSVVELSKFFSFFFSYLAGRIIRVHFKYSQVFAYLCFLSLLLFFISSLLGYGYQTWGAVKTFSGGYYFKTDMAMSAIISMAFISVFARHWLFLSVSVLIGGYLVFITNARIALPLVVVVPMLAIALRKGWVTEFNSKFIFYGLIVGVIGAVGLVLLDFVGKNMLGFDFSKPFSEANTQGRTVIWATILSFYFEASLIKQLFGLGLGADAYATSLLEGSHLAGVRAHNSFIYLLVCTGLIGLVVLSWFFFALIRLVPLLLNSSNIHFFRAGSLALIFVVVMLWFSLTTEAIIRPQLMIIVFFICGLAVQAHSLERRIVND